MFTQISLGLTWYWTRASWWQAGDWPTEPWDWQNSSLIGTGRTLSAAWRLSSQQKHDACHKILGVRSIRKQIIYCKYYIYRTAVTICIASLTFNSSTFCPHSVFVFCVDLRTNSDYFLIQHWLVFLQPRRSVYCAVRTECTRNVY